MNWKSVFGNLFGGSKNFFFKGEIIDCLTSFDNYQATKEKLEVILKNYALLKVFSTQCDLFSMGKFYVKDIKTDEYIENDPFLEFIKNPNPFQTQPDFLWSFMFNHMMGNGNIWGTSKIISNPLLRLYVLDNWKVEIDNNIKRFDELLESNLEVNRFFDKTITYQYNDGTTKTLRIGDIMSIKDLNVGDDWIGYQSRIDALYKVISNHEATQDSLNINIRYAGKFIVAGQSDPNNVTNIPMSEPEKNSIESKVNGPKSVHAVKSMVDIKRFIESVKSVGLTEVEKDLYSTIANVFGIPEEVAKAFAEKGSTYENQEKAKGGYVDYVLEPKGEKLCNALNNYFGYYGKGKKIIISWDHLAFMQVFEKEKSEIQDKKSIVMERLLKLNVPLDEINSFLDTEFKVARYDRTTIKNNS